jgi:hypothetical protein
MALKRLSKMTVTEVEAEKQKLIVALNHWGPQIQAMLDSEFGAKKMGYMLALFPFGGRAQVSWRSSARAESLAGMLFGLADHLAKDKSGLVKPSLEDIGYFG